jgi:hypothetical protein
MLAREGRRLGLSARRCACALRCVLHWLRERADSRRQEGASAQCLRPQRASDCAHPCARWQRLLALSLPDATTPAGGTRRCGCGAAARVEALKRVRGRLAGCSRKRIAHTHTTHVCKPSWA